ncbi:alpha/beta-Hydrolase [Glarea lozoyensis ATCC 20868]|uniref:cutinase n=1 Tax=Glarea lozoyensis (strain ATCC 20868 / MF5171) TaxID=1116229 RepID=S3D7R0_GLAL2|nr:alpha/beta-Hydrolase [Glarea lozoyensis ATCC 20868]EPE28051.1 alpha/beta-Hydrolase [Glarea lozoyensis ATCC 20868]
MRTSTAILSLLVSVVAGSPIESRQFGFPSTGRVGTTENEFTQGGCRDIIFFFARGSTEVGNMGSTVGPPTGQGLKDAFGAASVAVEGTDYPAGLGTNALPGGADPVGIRDMRDGINAAATQCPNSIIAVGGYSQGAAVVHRAVENLSASVKDKIAAAITYGDTQNLQDRGQIPNFPPEKTLVICNTGDAVCRGTLTILAPHLDYVRRVPEAVQFLTTRIRAAQ